MLLRVVLDCFRVYLGVFVVDVGFFKGLGLGYFGVLSKSCAFVKGSLTD